MQTKPWTSRRVKAMPKSMFAIMDEAKRQAVKKGREIIDLSIGSSDMSPPEAALTALRQASYDAKTYGYCLHSCTQAFREAAATWYGRRYKQVDPDKEVLSLIGAQEGLAHLLLAITDPGDTVLLPDPAYPSYFGAVELAGLHKVSMPLVVKNNFLPDLSAIAQEKAQQAKAMIVSYPNNPTAAVASAAFMQELVDFCHDNSIILIHDFPYVDMVYGDYEAPSILNQKGGMDVGIELFSCSKSFHMGGFRMGWAIGNQEAISALTKVKAAIDFNQYLGIQHAAIAALKEPRSQLRKVASLFQERRDSLVQTLREASWDVALPQASMYVWASLPKGFKDSFSFCVDLAQETGVCLAPGRGFGPSGEGYVRFALVRDPETLKQAALKIQAFI